MNILIIKQRYLSYLFGLVLMNMLLMSLQMTLASVRVSTELTLVA